MRGQRFEESQQIEKLPDLDELALADLAHQDDWQLELCAWNWFVGRRRWPLIGDHPRVNLFPAQFRPIGIGEVVCGFDA
jgi:hypothetical protein